MEGNILSIIPIYPIFIIGVPMFLSWYFLDLIESNFIWIWGLIGLEMFLILLSIGIMYLNDWITDKLEILRRQNKA